MVLGRHLEAKEKRLGICAAPVEHVKYKTFQVYRTRGDLCACVYTSSLGDCKTPDELVGHF